MTVRFFTRSRLAPLAAALLGATLLVGRGARAQQPAPAPGVSRAPDGILVDLQDTDIRTVITALAEAAGLNVIFSDLPARRVTLRLRHPVPADSVRGLLRTIAEANGLRVYEQGGVLRFEGPPVGALGPSTPAGGAAARGADVQLFVYRLRHANAVRLAATLQSIFGGGGGGPVAGPSRAPLSQRLQAQQIPPVTLDSSARRPRGAVEGAAPMVGVFPGQLQGDVQIVPDETTNSLLVRATVADWAVIQQAIAAVDLRPLQVLIEVLVAEVRRTSDLEVSVGGTAERTGRRNASGAIGADTSGLAVGEMILRWMNGGRVDIDVALRALSTRGQVRILSRPVLLAQSNQEAHILIGSQQPFIQSSLSTPTDVIQRDIIQFQKVGTQLTILPTVNPDGYVNLELTQEVSAATTETRFGAPVISTREASTFLFVKDGQTTVIGGLIDRQGEKTRSGVPVLINIPLLGGLFGSTHNSTSVSELFLFLTPHVVTSDDDVDRMREDIERRLQLLERELPKVPPVVPPSREGPP